MTAGSAGAGEVVAGGAGLRTVVITGASDGIGAAAARVLHRSGRYRLVLVGRSPAKTATVAAELGAEGLVADFTRLDDVRRLAADLVERCPRLDVLANNAGVAAGAPRLTVDGHEATFQVNHLGPFLLTLLLADRLAESRASVLFTSSAAHRWGAIDVTATGDGTPDLGSLGALGPHDPMHVYGTTKLMNVLTAVELSRRWAGRGVAAASFHPGLVATGFATTDGGALRFVYGSPLRHLLTRPDRGARTLTWLVDGTPGRDWQPGAYYYRRKARRLHGQARDADLARRLWERSAALVGLPG